MKREFTGKHMTAILVGGFAIVISVNMFMAYKATHDFGGVVVENSYVASQKYNEWLNQAEREKALGWEVSAVRDELGHLSVTAKGAPEGLTVIADLRRPLGSPEHREEVLISTGNGRFVSSTPIPAGRWLARVTVAAGSRKLRHEANIG